MFFFFENLVTLYFNQKKEHYTPTNLNTQLNYVFYSHQEVTPNGRTTILLNTLT